MTDTPNITDLPDWAQTLIGDLRKESADKRTENRTLTTRVTELEQQATTAQELAQQHETTAQQHATALQAARDQIVRAAGIITEATIDLVRHIGAALLEDIMPNRRTR